MFYLYGYNTEWEFVKFEEGIWMIIVTVCNVCIFFFQAEDGIRDSSVTGVQTCALPIYIDAPCGRPRPTNCFPTRRASAPSRAPVTWSAKGAPPTRNKRTATCSPSIPT